MANGGSLFLDEIGDISLDVQIKLLRVLQERTFEPVGSSTPMTVDVRVIAATHQNLERLIAEGKFREDLYYRLNVISVTLPPLRERREDLFELAIYFLTQAAERAGKPVTMVDEMLSKRCRPTTGPAIFANCRTSSSGLSCCAKAIRSPWQTCRMRWLRRLSSRRPRRLRVRPHLAPVPCRRWWPSGPSSGQKASGSNWSRHYSDAAATRLRRPACSVSRAVRSSVSSADTGWVENARRTRPLDLGSLQCFEFFPACCSSWPAA